MKELEVLFKNNKSWVARKLEQDSKFFENLAKSQNPKYLWIGCSDSRVPANEIVGLEPGELFVHRNIANLFINIDINCLSVLEYAVNFLNVKHIIICGHYGCGGVKAAMEEQTGGVIDHWLLNIRELLERHKDDLSKLPSFNDRHDRLVELNVKQQVLNVCQSPIVQKAWKQRQNLWVHGWIYDLKTGKLKDLNLCFSKNDIAKKNS